MSWMLWKESEKGKIQTQENVDFLATWILLESDSFCPKRVI